MQEALRRLLDLGPMPSEASATEKQVRAYQNHIEAFTSPVSDEAAAALVGILPVSDDSLLGVAWSILHFIESAPSWPVVSSLHPPTGWKRRLWRSCANAGLFPTAPPRRRLK